MAVDVRWACIGLLMVVIVFGYQRYTNKILELEKANVEAIAAKEKAESMLNKQNAAINALKLTDKDKKKLDEYMKDLDKNTVTTIYRVEQQIIKDSSESNKLKIMDNLLKEFANE